MDGGTWVHPIPLFPHEVSAYMHFEGTNIEVAEPNLGGADQQKKQSAYLPTP